MAGEDAAAAASAGTKAVKKLPKEEVEDDDDEDDVPLALSKGKKASASKVKKEELDKLPLSGPRAKKGNEKQKNTVGSNAKTAKPKKEEVDSDDADGSDDDFKPLAHKKSAGASGSNAKTSKVKKLKDEDLEDIKDVKKTRKSINAKGDGKMATGKEDKVKKERKVYELPGQKHDPPAERDPLRIFYESLHEQVPTSDMAATWMMERGLLPLDVAKKVFEKKQGQKLKSPVKTTTVKRKPASPTNKTPSSAKKIVAAAKSAGKATSQKKRKASSDTEDDDDDDFMVSKAKTKRQKASS